MTILLILTAAVAVYTVIRHAASKHAAKQMAVSAPQKQLGRINTLLRNIDVYYGTASGQIRIDGGDII